MSVAPARKAALEVLHRVRERDAWSGPVLDAVLTKARLTHEDAALATRLARGTLSASATLDEAIARFASKPGRIEPRVGDALRLSAYELLFMHTPARAAVHQGVEAARAVRPQAAGLANAVLRRLADAAPDFPWGDPDSDVSALARLTAHPEWLVRRLLDERGPDAARAVLHADQEPGPLYLWHNPFAGTLQEAVAALTSDGAAPAEGPLPGSVIAGEPAAAVHGTAVSTGLVLVTDAAAQLAPRVLEPAPGSSVIDLTAGRGTKTAELQALAVGAGAPAGLVAVDLHEFKTGVLRDRLDALGVPGVVVLAGDATDPASIEGLPPLGTADAVLLDAPCSGLGSLRRHPEARWRVTPDTVRELASLQAALLRGAARLVRPGGHVVYSTCTVLREENDDVVRGFMDEHAGGFRVRSVDGAVPQVWTGYITPEGFFQSLPSLGGPDGHFVACLERCD